MAAAQPARSLVVGSAEERQPLVTECEIRGVVAKGCGRGTMVSGSVATVKTSTFEKCVITGAINYVKS
jgi:hypothetical protein